jgi:hypothetical protein
MVPVGSSACAGRVELLEAVSLAHADYLIDRGGHLAAAFAMTYNPRLLAAHMRLSSTAPATITSFGRLPQWAGGTASENTRSAQKRAQEMIAALEATQRKRVGNGGSSSEVRSDTWLPGLAPPLPRPAAAEVSWVGIQQGTCAAQHLRRMNRAECEAYARSDKKHFIGESVERREYPGCTLWIETSVVEFNNHDDEGGGCNLPASRGRCVCMRT